MQGFSNVPTYLKGLMVAVVLGVVAFSGHAAWKEYHAHAQSIDSFKECVEAGNHVTGGAPRTCTTKDGKSYLDYNNDAGQTIR